MICRFILFCLIACANIQADAPKWQLNDPEKGWSDNTLVLEYFHHSELQRQWSWELIGRYPLKGSEKILDFGCGDGKITAELSYCLPNGQIIGVDLSEQMVSFAQRSFPKQNYPSLSFVRSEDIDFEIIDLTSPEKFDRIYSFFVFHLVANPQTVLSNLRKKIEDDGQLFLVLPKGGNRPFFEAATLAFNDYDLQPPWMKSKTHKNKATMRTVEGVKNIIESSGWSISHLAEVKSAHAFITREQFTHWLIGTLTANWDIPIKIAPDFFQRLVEHMVEIDPTIIDRNGTYNFQLSRVHVVANPA